MTAETLHVLRDGGPRLRLTSKKRTFLLIGGVIVSMLLLAGWVTAPFTIGGAPDTVSSIVASPVPGHPEQCQIRLRVSRADGACVNTVWELSDHQLVDESTSKPLALAQWIDTGHVSATRYYWDVVLQPALRTPRATATPVSLTMVAATYPATTHLQWIRWRLTGAPIDNVRSLPGNLLSARVTLPAALRR